VQVKRYLLFFFPALEETCSFYASAADNRIPLNNLEEEKNCYYAENLANGIMGD
jgi:hypothetical protein